MDRSILASPVAFSVAKNQLSALTTLANASGQPFVIEKNHKPWVKVTPLAVKQEGGDEIRIKPLKQKVQIPDIDDLFEGYTGSSVAKEDGFVSAVGDEVL